MHTHPLNRLVGAVTFAHWLEISDIVKQHRMAVHARLRRRHAGSRGTLDARVAIAAIDAVVAHVVFVAELNRLIARNVLVRQIRRARREQHTGQCDAGQKHACEDTESRDEVCASMKNLRHVYVCTLQVSAPGGSEHLGVHQQQTGMCEPVSNLTRRVSNKTFWIANSFSKTIGYISIKSCARETLGLFKTFEKLTQQIADRFLSHFEFSPDSDWLQPRVCKMKFRFGSRLAFTEQISLVTTPFFSCFWIPT